MLMFAFHERLNINEKMATTTCYVPEWSYTKALNHFPDNSADATRSTVLVYVSSYIWQVEMSQYPVRDFVNTQVFSH
jgi:hypothetical protein